MSDQVTVAERESVLGGDTEHRGWLEQWSWRQYLLVGLLVIPALVLVVVTQSPIVLAVVLGLGVVGWGATRRRDVAGDSWLQGRWDAWRAVRGRRNGADTYDPAATEGEPRELPREVGRVEFLAVSPAAGAGELAVVRHGTDYMTTVLEVIGGGDGLRETRETAAHGIAFGRVLYGLSRTDLPIDQVDITTRVLPMDSSEYQAWIETSLDHDAPAALVDNLREVAALVDAAEAYRSHVTLSMPLDALTARVARTGATVTQETLAEAAWEATGAAARLIARQGWVVRQGLTPRRLGAVIRHTYAPSYGLDDLGGLTGPRDGFLAYTAHKTGVEVHAPDGSTWWHAGASLPKDGWPLSPVTGRWLEPLISDVYPATIHAVTAQHRLIPKNVMRNKAALALTLDDAELLRQRKRGETSTGVREAQAEGASTILGDLLYQGAAGDMVALHLHVSAPTALELEDARERIASVAQDSKIERIRWHEGRHHHAMLLALPLGRGIPR